METVYKYTVWGKINILYAVPEEVGGPGAAGHLVHGAEDQVVLRVPHQAEYVAQGESQ